MLICTDLMVRGIDFKTVNSVVNFDFPTSIVSYIHRVGRTGRAGREGEAITMFTDDDAPYVKAIATLIQKSGGAEMPEWMANLKSADNKDWKRLEMKPTKRKHLSTDIDRNTNKRVVKMIRKDTARLAKSAAKGQGDAGQQAAFMEEEEQLDSDLAFGSEDDEGAIQNQKF